MLKILSILSIALIIFSGCETEHDYVQVVVNNTDGELKLKFQGADIVRYGDSIVIPAYSDSLLQAWNKFGRHPQGVGCTSNQNVVMYYNDTSIITKTFNSELNWEQMITGKRTIYESCTLTINQSDI